jgi:hypothetical protein
MEQKAETAGVLRMRGRSGDVPPTVEEARPRICPQCGQPAYEGGEVWIHGHGVVQRQQSFSNTDYGGSNGVIERD